MWMKIPLIVYLVVMLAVLHLHAIGLWPGPFLSFSSFHVSLMDFCTSPALLFWMVIPLNPITPSFFRFSDILFFPTGGVMVRCNCLRFTTPGVNINSTSDTSFQWVSVQLSIYFFSPFFWFRELLMTFPEPI